MVISLVASYILCNTKQNDADIDPVKVEEYTAVLENSVDLDSIAGTYCGVLPPNVETILTLNADGTYRLKRKSANESDSCEVLNGIFKVIDGSILMLEHPSSGDNIFYKVKNDSGIILIDSFGNEPKARDSKLLKFPTLDNQSVIIQLSHINISNPECCIIGLKYFNALE